MSATGRVGIVGGSIGGCAAAVALSRSGWDVEVLERSAHDLISRGAGIGTITPFLDALIERDVIGADLRRLDGRPMRWVGCDPNVRSGRVFGSDPVRLPMSTLTWGDLYAQLRDRVPAGTYARGHEVVEIDPAGGHPSVLMADGGRRHYDVVVCADGYQSLGRSTLFPNSVPAYRGYVLWRGVLPEGSVNPIELLGESGVRCGYPGGHGVFYLVPSASRDGGRLDRDINWGLYLQVPAAELPELLTDRLGRRSSGSVAAGQLAPEAEAALKARATELLPETFAEVVGASRDTFVQAIFSVTVPAYHRGRVCLVGDAGTLHPPFTGSGVFKAITNALELAHRLHVDGDLDHALAAWNDRQLRDATSFAAAAEVLERELIFEMPDLREYDDDAFAGWNSKVWAQVP